MDKNRNIIELLFGERKSERKAIGGFDFLRSDTYSSTNYIQGWKSKAGYFDVEDIGDGQSNSAVVACLQTLGTSFAEPKITIKTMSLEGEEETLYFHPFTLLMERPNPYMSGDMILQYMVNAIHVSGDAYLLKTKNAIGEVVSLYPLMPEQVTPKGDEVNLISYYEYQMPEKIIRIEVEDMVHIRTGLDPTDHKSGFAPLKTVLREIYGDESAGQLGTALLSNMGIPGLIISPTDDYGPNEEEAKEITRTFKRKFGGANRGEPLVMSGNMKVETLSLSPRELDIGTLRRIPEERISAVLGVPAILAGLGAGLDRATYSNAKELREYFTENKLIPLWRQVAQELTYQLLIPDFGFQNNSFVNFDTNNVRALQTDQNDLYTRMTIAVKNGWATMAEAREAVGLPVEENQEVYYVPQNIDIVKADELDEHAMEHGTESIKPDETALIDEVDDAIDYDG